MIGLGAAIGAVGAIGGGIAAARAARKQIKMIKQQQKENQDWFDRRYNEDATQKADAQRILTMTEESIRNRNRQAAGAQAVMGGTDESTAAAKAANNKALVDATSAINANAEQQKSEIENKYLDTKADLNNKLQELQGQKAQAISDAIKGVSSAASSIMGGGGAS